MSTKREDFQNRALALLLRQQGLDADFEQAAGRRRIDVVARVDGLRVVLEAETGFNRKAQAIKDADARLKQGLTVAAFAVCYPLGVTDETLHDATLTWTLRTRAGLPAGEWAVGDIPMLARAVRQTPASLSGADGAQILSDATRQWRRSEITITADWLRPLTFRPTALVQAGVRTWTVATASRPSAACWWSLRPCCRITCLCCGPRGTLGIGLQIQ